MKYTVKYKKKGDFFWKTIRNVTGDFTIHVRGDKHFQVPTPPTMVFDLEDMTRIEIPIDGTEFRYSKERFLLIKKKLESESGQSIKLKV